MKFPLSILAGSVVALALGTAAASATDIETATGAVEIDRTPKTIAVYDIAALDTINALGVTVAGVPDRLFLPELQPLARTAEVVGTIFEPDLEALNALAPDLVVVGGRSARQASETARVAQTIDMTIDGTELLDETLARIETYGILFGKEDRAETLAATLDEDIAEARAAVEGKGDALIIMTNGPKISVYGPGTRFGWLHSELGIPPAVDDLGAGIHGDAVSFEFVASANPDWLIVVDRAAAIGSGEQNARATLDNVLVRGTKAWSEGHVIYLPAADFYIAAGGADATGRILKAITEGFTAGK
ncbi:iron ABC transporter substrate-binding protein [Acuticoccus sediminis]|uniref:Iron ABC transporter substrate-binding protein n=1 Tax=Acuticoccus sediminis TaxID=2184697 RepID=A0A8B2NJH3_9HYPH|nr:siderophore ABC transporter substrate-binding protein [Acuticoccus sediminis]RAH98426.1 iron ABC transporter substrate-binding protein [Acuticoccus sediminis]